MVGLLDSSGGMDAYAGLLPPDMQKAVQQRQLLGLAQGLLQAGAPSRMPVGFGQALGQGLQGMQQGQDTGIQQAMQAQLLQSQLKKNSLEKLAPGEMMYDVNTGKPSVGNSIFGQTTSDPNAISPNVNLHGDDFLKTVPPQIATQVKAYADGRQPWPGGMAMKTPYFQQMLQAVGQYDPNFDAVNYNSRANTRKSFTSGQDANNITALNTAMSHAASLKDAYDNLDNTDYPAVNTAKNWLGNTFGSDNIQTNTAAVGTRGHALSEELAKVFRSTGMAESDVKAWESKLSDAATPAQSKEVLNSAMDLMDGRLNALSTKYNQGMGTTKTGIELLSPEAQRAYAKVRGAAPANTNSNQTATPQNPNVTQSVIKPPEAAIQHLKDNPSLAPAFEAKYGVSAKNYLGM